jgi:aspartyl protease family protein
MALALNASAQSIGEAGDLFSQIQALQNQNKIEVIGLENIQNGNKVLISGSLEQQVKQLFSSYNHVVSRDTKGKIERIVIINKKQKRKDTRIVLPTSLQGNHFIVPVSLTGNGSSWQNLDMVIDTGADLVVLPSSMITELGLTDSKFTQAKMQTANGVADAKIGLLQEVRIAGEVIDNVEVAFIADQLLGGNKLLGMSVLGRYQVNIDDKSQIITLIKK